MTISNSSRKAGPFTGDGATVALPFSFKVFSAADLLVVQSVVATGVETTKVLGTDYTVALNADQNATPGGTVTMLAPAPTGTTTTLTSQVAYTQSTDLTNAGGFYPKVINDALDRATIQIQQLSEKIGRLLGFPLSEALTTTLPGASARANKLLSFDSTGAPVVVAPASQSSSDVALQLANTSNPAQGVALVGGAARVVDSIAALRALPKTGSPRVIATGYYAVGDGGGGQYYYDAADTTSTDNAGTVIVAADGGRWKLVVQNGVSVLQFGAKPDNGVTNNATAFNACGLWCWQNNVKMVIPGSGKNLAYGFTTPFTNNGWGTSGNPISAMKIDSDPTAVMKAYAVGASPLVDFTKIYIQGGQISLPRLDGNSLAAVCAQFTNIQTSDVTIPSINGATTTGCFVVVPNTNPSNLTVFNNRFYVGVMAGMPNGYVAQSPVSSIFAVQGNQFGWGQLASLTANGITIGQPGGDSTQYNTFSGGVAESCGANGIADYSGRNNIIFANTNSNVANGVVVFSSAFPDTITGVFSDNFTDQTGKCIVNAVDKNNLGAPTFTDVTGSRALATNYTNNTNRTIWVLACIKATSASPTAINATVGAVTQEGTVVAAVNYISQMSFPVPPGKVYQVSVLGGTATLQSWAELA